MIRAPQESSLAEESISNFASEAKEKVESNQARLVCYKNFKGDLPTKMKVSPIVEIPHKSKAFRSILDLSFSLKLTPHGSVPSVNENSERASLGGAIYQIRHVLLRLIHAFTEAPDCANIFQAKLDIKDGFWRLDFKEGGRIEFLLCLTTEARPSNKLVVPTLH